MDIDIIISVTETEVQLALLEDKKLVELHREKKGDKVHLGDVYVGKVKKIMPGLNACFVDLGEEKDGFAHYEDLGGTYASLNKYMKLAMNGDASMATLKGFQPEPTMEKNGNIADWLQLGQLIVAQVCKEPISTKGPKLTCDLSLAGHYLVLMPFCNHISISQKIRSKSERNRLRRLMTSIIPENFGVIVRTSAEGKEVAELDADLRLLSAQWAAITNQLKRITGPQRLLSEQSTASAMLREVMTDEVRSIYVDNDELYKEVLQYVSMVAPDKVDMVHPYKLETPIYEQMGVARDIRRAFGRIVSIRSGVYLYVEHTEAMHVIDVNSGNHIKAGEGQEDTALQVNIESAQEIARQIRLRDMGGIIIIDFIDMNKSENRKQLYDVMCEAMSRDKARHTILPLSKFGLMQITRHRVRPAVEVNVQEKCPLCEGKGTIKSSLTVVDDIETNLRYLTSTQNVKRLSLTVHPYVHAYLTQGGLRSLRVQWMRKYKVWLKINKSEAYWLITHKFFDATGNEITL